MQLKNSALLKQQVYIDGEWLEAENGEKIVVKNPATEQVIAYVPRVSASQVEKAVEAADRAFESWEQTTAKERSVLLRKWFDLIVAHQEDLAIILSTDRKSTRLNSSHRL